MNTRQRKRGVKRVRTILDSRAESIVMDWANTTTEYPHVIETTARPLSATMLTEVERADAAIKRLIRRSPEVFSSLPVAPPLPADRDSDVPDEHFRVVREVQGFLRLAWEASDFRKREWYIFQARDKYHYFTVIHPLFIERVRKYGPREFEIPLTPEEEAARTSVPAFTPFEQVLYHLQRIATRMRHCHNPECPAPYFLVKKKGQKYCSSKCSAPMQRLQKREWWRTHRAKRAS